MSGCTKSIQTNSHRKCSNLTFSALATSVGLGENVTFRLSTFGFFDGDISVRGDVVSPSLQEIIQGASPNVSL